MNENINTPTNAPTDMVAKDFLAAVVVVSLTINLAVLTTWLTVSLS